MYQRLMLKARQMAGARRAVQRRQEIEADIPDLTRYLAACLRAGLSLRQALAEASERMRGPISEELSIAVGETKAGVPIAEALAGLASRAGSADAATVSSILRTSLRYGGDTASALDRLSAVTEARKVMSGEVKALTAQARFSAVILSILPLGFFLVFPASAEVVMSPRGLAAVLAGLVLNAAGYIILRWMSNPERLG